MRVRASERAAVSVEAALVTPIIVSLLFGIVEAGFFFKDYLAAASAVRAAARIASAEPRNSLYAQSAADKIKSQGAAMYFPAVEALWVYKANPTNDFPTGYSDFTNCTTCVKFAWNGTTFVPLAGTSWSADSQNACSGAGGPPDRIGIYIRLRHQSLTGLLFENTAVSDHVVMRFEPIPVSGGCK